MEKFINTDKHIPMSTKLQTALRTMTVSIEVLRSWFLNLKKIIRRFWRTLYN
jgi:hypothetical protein